VVLGQILAEYTYDALDEAAIAALCKRPGSAGENEVVETRVMSILADVRLNKDEALRRLTLEHDQVNLSRLWYNADEIASAARQVSETGAAAIRKAYSNIHTYHQAQTFNSAKIETSPGVECWRERRPIDTVGLYIPGGSAVLPSTFLMLGIPALLAGVPEIVVCSPPQKGIKGQPSTINPYIAFVARLLGIDRIYSVGGAQAIGAMAFGTESIPAVAKIFGPGNRYVTLAKQLVQQQAVVGIDMPAGPSEVLIIADSTAQAAFVAADLLAQAEHGPDSQVVFVTNNRALATQVQHEARRQMDNLPRKAIVERSLANSFILMVDSLDDALSFSNRYAPEHLIVCLAGALESTSKVTAAGSVFIGNYSPESAGDYASGTNHTLPTSGFARMYSGLSLDSFSKQISFQRLTETGLAGLAPTLEELAQIEGLDAHKRAVTIRTDFLKQET